MKKVHIISHSHLDREWYLPLIEHQMYLVNLLDNVLLLSKEENFDSFHLDGQIIPLEDYFKVKPENKGAILELINSGKLRIGPWYILQDAFLISSESNLRNLQVGIKEMKKYFFDDYKKNMNIGYFPDTFGNPGQIPQIIKRANMDIAYFGRGVKATGFNNVVIDDYSSKNSEMLWKSKDGTEILAILFANWYSNGNEIPVNEEEAKIFWDKKLKDVENFASTKHLLMMNGCDHQPLQMDILKAIEVANKLYPDYEFVHSNLSTYTKEILEEIKEKNIKLSKINGELRSQNTDGWYSLQGTSSSRVYLKQLNKKCEYLLEEVVEPLLNLIYTKESYPLEKIDYAWKILLSNHPHDSICGCSIDSVHKGMEDRFKEVIELSNHLVNRALYDYALKVDTSEYEENKYLITVHNMSQYSGIKECEISVDLKKINFKDVFYEKGYEILEKERMPKSFKIYDNDKLIYQGNIKDTKVIFDYELPYDKFRQSFWAKRVILDAHIYMDSFSRKTFEIKFFDDILELENKIDIFENIIENKYIKLEINKDGTFNIYDKESQNLFTNLGYIEDSGDVGNEYIYKESLGSRIYSNNIDSRYEIFRVNQDRVDIIIYDEILIPKSASKDLVKAQIKMEEVTKRNISRSEEKVKFIIQKTLSLETNSKVVKFNVKFKNNVKDHRLRIIFPTDINTEHVYAESIYEVAKRNIKPSLEWINPDNSQNLNRFVNLKDDNNKRAISIATDAIAEYEVIEDNKLALTLSRFIGELGDWGYFPTEDSQGFREYDLTMYIDIYSNDDVTSYHRLINARKKYLCNQIESNKKGNISSNFKYNLNLKNLFLTAFKRNYNKERIIRVCNYFENEEQIYLENSVEMDIIEDSVIDTNINPIKTIKAYEIRTFKMEE